MPWTERERSIMGDVYRIMQKFVDPPMKEPESDVYWSLLAATLNEFAVKWGINHLTINAASFITGWLQDVYKEKRDAEWKIEAAATKYRETSDFGEQVIKIMQETECPNDDRTAQNCQTAEKLFENDTENPSPVSKCNKSSHEGDKPGFGAEIKKKTINQSKEADKDGIYGCNDSRIRDGMLCFL